MPNIHPIACGCKACRGPDRGAPIAPRPDRPFLLLSAFALVLATIAAML